MRDYLLPVLAILGIGLLAAIMWFSLDFRIPGIPDHEWALVSASVAGPDCLSVEAENVYHAPAIVVRNACPQAYNLLANQSDISASPQSRIAPAVQVRSEELYRPGREIGRFFCSYLVNASAAASCTVLEVPSDELDACRDLVCNNIQLPADASTAIIGLDGPFRLEGEGVEISGELRSQPYKPWPLSLLG